MGLVAGALMRSSVTAHSQLNKKHSTCFGRLYYAPQTVAEFERKPVAKVVYDVSITEEVLEGKLMAGSTGFD